MSLMLTNSAFSQQKQKQDPKAVKAQEAKQEAKMKAELAEQKALEEKRQTEANALAAAEATKAQESEGVLGYVKSKFSASYHGEFSFTRKGIESVNEADRDLQDLRIMHNPTVIYRPIPNVKLLATSEFKYTDAEAKGTFINRHFRSLVLLTRENVLTEVDNGIKLDLGIGRRINDRNHGAATSYGNSRITSSLSKKFSDKLSTAVYAQYLLNDPVLAKIKRTTWKQGLNVIPSFTFQITEKLSYFFNDDFTIYTPRFNDNAKDVDMSHDMNVGVLSYQFNDKNSSYFQLKYVRSANESFQEIEDTVEYTAYYIGHTYTVTPKLSVTGEIGSTLTSARDSRDFFAKDIKYPDVALYLDYSL